MQSIKKKMTQFLEFCEKLKNISCEIWQFMKCLFKKIHLGSIIYTVTYIYSQ